MNINEAKMKRRGEDKVWKSIQSKSGSTKQIASTQVGQKIILDEALEVLPKMREWIENDSGKLYRRELQNCFPDDDILLEKIAQVYLFLAGSINMESQGESLSNSRHKKVNTIKSRIMPDASFELAWRFIETSIDFSQYFNVEKVLKYDNKGFSWSFKYNCLLNDVILEKLTLEAAEAFYPMPMLTKPIDWTFEDNILMGGYETFQYELVRASRKIDYNLYSQKIFDTVNYIQSVSWRVNKTILHQVLLDLQIPLKRDYVKSEYPDLELSRWDVDLTKESLTAKEVEEIQNHRKDFRERVELYNAEIGDYESAMGKYRAIKMATQIAERYQDEILYFPHSYDFRGRIYPISVGLTPQGSDAVKAMLEYNQGEVLNERGEKWMWAYLASLYGDDKITFEERVERGKELLSADYKQADEPYQFLAHQIEINKWLADPTYEVKARIHLDACNSGSQFTSTITGDRAGCIATNVIPTFGEDGICIRKDAYLLVSEKALSLTKELIKKTKDDPEQKEMYIFFKGLLEENGRKICKTPVMVSNYGGTAGGRSEILWNMMRELQVDRKWITKKVASAFGKVIGESITGVLNGGKAFETYIQQMNGEIAKENKHVWWTTSDGFHIIHVKHKELKSKQISCLLPGARKKTSIIKKIFSNNVSPAKMKSAISPNYIHSLDAELLRRVALKMKRQGIEYTDWIHDSFGCHPNHVDIMLDITKREFQKLARRAPLRQLDKELREQCKSKKRRDKESLEKIKLPQLRGFNAANGDLDIVIESEWFFS